jgi:hypothetical protein
MKPELWKLLTDSLVQELGDSALNLRSVIYVTNDLYKARVKDNSIYNTMM